MTAQEASKMSKMASKIAKMVPREPKMAPRCLQDGPGCASSPYARVRRSPPSPPLPLALTCPALCSAPVAFEPSHTHTHTHARRSVWAQRKPCPTTMSEPPSKAPRLIYAATGHHVSQRALEALFAHIRAEGLPEVSSRASYARERHAVAHSSSDFGPLLQRVRIPHGRKSFDLWVQHPLAMLQITCEKNPVFREEFLRAFDRARGHMNIAIYNDEVDPGKELAARHARKIEIVYWTFVDFGFPSLSNENCWFTLFACRSEVRAEIDGGMSHLLKEALRLFFGRPDGYDLRDGVQLNIRGTGWSRLLFASVSIMNNDELAHKGITRAKGASGFKSCSVCLNVHDHKYADPSGRLVPNTEVDERLFIKHTDQSIVRTLAVLKDNRGNINCVRDVVPFC